MSWGSDRIVRSRWPALHIPDNMSLMELMFTQWQTFPRDLVALQDVATGEKISFVKLRACVVHLARDFAARGVRHGDRICIFAANHVDYAAVALAGALLGAVVCVYNPLYTASELGKLVEETQPVLAVVNRMNLVAVQQLSAPNGVWTALRHVLLLEQESFQGYQSVRSVWAGKDLEVNAHEEWRHAANIRPREDTCLMPYSSGTTGLPKGVMLTHYNLVANIRQLMKIIGEDPKSQMGNVQLLVMPLYHVSGLVGLLLGGLAAGKCSHVMVKFDPNVYLQQVSETKSHQLSVVPPILVYFNKSGLFNKYDLSNVTNIIVGAAPLDKETEKETCRLLPSVTHFDQAYGMSETSCIAFANSQNMSRAGSVGHPAPNVEAVVVDPDTGKRVGPGQRGEIWMRGPMVMKGYWCRPQATASTVDKDGWLHSGDVGYFDGDGFLFIVDRLKELIKYKGYQVAPAELEGLLLSHPDVADAAVIGVPDALSGELPRGYVVLKAGRHCTPEQIAQFVSGLVSPQKHLRGGVRLVKEIPKSAAGKILRRVLRDAVQKERDGLKSRL